MWSKVEADWLFNASVAGCENDGRSRGGRRGLRGSGTVRKRTRTVRVMLRRPNRSTRMSDLITEAPPGDVAAELAALSAAVDHVVPTKTADDLIVGT